jgi:three-Cys-motif partner protein
MRQVFGGTWTETKLEALENYLKAYMTIMRKNERAIYFTTTYLDGFAGSGRRYAEGGQEPSLFGHDFEESDVQGFYRGSAIRALELPNPFDKYIFIETDKARADQLESVAKTFPNPEKIHVIRQDANVFIPQWCLELAPLDRVLVFLDPYGMQVEWSTVQAIAKTQRADVWILVPIGQAIARLLTRQELPPSPWAERLTRFFGTEAWKEALYRHKQNDTLFGRMEATERTADCSAITEFTVKRLKKVFAQVLDDPIVLRNSKNAPLYVLCFAASNPKGAKPAIKIAKHIARKFNNG